MKRISVVITVMVTLFLTFFSANTPLLAGNLIPYQALGVTYNGLHATTNPNVSSVNADLSKIKNFQMPGGGNFTAIRTYYPQFSGDVGVMTQVNEVAPQLKVLLGLYLFECHGQPADWTEGNLSTYVLPFLKNSNISGVLVGNEEGASSVNIAISYIDKVRQANPKIPIGSAQASDFWLNNPAAAALAAKCDFIAANIYPTWNWQSAGAENQPYNNSVPVSIQKGFTSFVNTYNAIVQKYPGKQVVVTETGWPTTYGWVVGVPAPEQYQLGLDNATGYFKLVSQWAKQNKVVVYYYSMFDDYYGVDTSSQYNFHFGLLDNGGNVKHVSASRAGSQNLLSVKNKQIKEH